jgi:hypothetical protein
VLGLVRSEARLTDAAQQVLERLVAEEVDGLVGEGELHLLRRLARHAARAEHRLLRAGHLGRLGDVQVALLHEPLHDLVQQLGELALQVGVALGVSGGLATQHLQHLGRELARVHQRLEDRLAQGVHRPVGVVAAELPPEGVIVGAAREPRLQQEVRELVEQALEVDRVGQLGEVLRVSGGAHDLLNVASPGGGKQPGGNRCAYVKVAGATSANQPA